MRRLGLAAAFLLCLGVLVSAPAASQETGGSNAAAAGGSNMAAAGGADGAQGSPAAGPAGAPTAPAASAPGGSDFDPTQFIGLDLKSALDALGAPQAVFSFRGQVEAQDNVVFFYRDFLYLFWYRNRVWQVRCDRRFARPLFGVAMGMPREVIERSSPRQFISKGDSLFFDLEEAKYPLRVRLVFSNDALSDIYIYRSDF
jgi:hypothetical protein